MSDGLGLPAAAFAGDDQSFILPTSEMAQLICIGKIPQTPLTGVGGLGGLGVFEEQNHAAEIVPALPCHDCLDFLVSMENRVWFLPLYIVQGNANPLLTFCSRKSCGFDQLVGSDVGFTDVFVQSNQE
jgi:hypothetical protein